MLLLMWFMFQMLTIFMMTSIMNKLMMLIFQIISFFLFLNWFMVSQWLFYLISITFVSGLLVLFMYTITTLKKEHKFYTKEFYMWSVLMLLGLLLFMLCNSFIFDYILFVDNMVKGKDSLKSMLKDNNFVLILKAMLLLTLMLMNSNILLKTIKLSLRYFK